jgi:hypothetical protein
VCDLDKASASTMRGEKAESHGLGGHSGWQIAGLENWDFGKV